MMIINSKHYFNNLKKDILDENEQKAMIDYETYIASCIEYQDFLLQTPKNALNTYYKNIIDLQNAMQEQENKLTQREIAAINKYYEMQDNMLRKSESVQKKLVPKENNNVSLGYANAFIVLLSTVATGIITALILYFTIK